MNASDRPMGAVREVCQTCDGSGKSTLAAIVDDNDMGFGLCGVCAGRGWNPTDQARDKAAHSAMVYSWTADDMKDFVSPVEAYGLVDQILVAVLSMGDTK